MDHKFQRIMWKNFQERRKVRQYRTGIVWNNMRIRVWEFTFGLVVRAYGGDLFKQRCGNIESIPGGFK